MNLPSLRKAERESRGSLEKIPLFSLMFPHGDCGTQLLTALLGGTCQYPVLFFTGCFTYLPQRRRRSAVLTTPGVQLDTNVNRVEEKQLAPKVLSLFST